MAGWGVGPGTGVGEVIGSAQAIHGYPWISMNMNGYQWISMVIHECPRISIDIHGYPWISMEVHGNQWASMDINRYPSIWTSGENRAIVNPRLTIVNPKCMDLGWIPIELDRFSIRMGGELVGIDSKGNANTTYISEFHPHIPAGWISPPKKGCRLDFPPPKRVVGTVQKSDPFQNDFP